MGEMFKNCINMFENKEFKFYLTRYWIISHLCYIDNAFGKKKYSVDKINEILMQFKNKLK